MSEATGKNCLWCKHWKGPREEALDQIHEHGLKAIDEVLGWSGDGECFQGHRLPLEIHKGGPWGGGVPVLFTPAWFGCVMFEAHQGHPADAAENE